MRSSKDVAILTILCAVYVITGKLGLQLAFIQPNVTAVWPPAGIALAALIIFGWRFWPAVFVGAFLVNITTAGSFVTSLAIASGNALEAVAAASLIQAFAGGRHAFDTSANVFRFAAIMALAASISATCGVTSLGLGGFSNWANYETVWTTWWLGDVTGGLIVAPFVILWATGRTLRWDLGKVLEGLILALSLIVVGTLAFGGVSPFVNGHAPFEFLCMPFLVWVAFRFNQRKVVTALFGLAAIAVWGTLHGDGPFAGRTHNDSLVLLQAFMSTMAVMSLALAAVVAERRVADEQLRQLVISDPLTGLANYRRLLDVLTTEIARSQRTHRSFAVLFFDLDGLKRINDQHGHLVGSEALCRMGEVLRGSCRTVDTAARFGGDEFAMILPETGGVGATQVARRVTERLAADTTEPQLSASFGSAVYPEDGVTAETLLRAADLDLYEMKARVHSKRGSWRASRSPIFDDRSSFRLSSAPRSF